MVKPRELSFKTLCDFFAAVAAARSTKRKALLLRSLLDKNLERTRDDVYDVIRLVLPRRDTRRGNYELQEAKLAQLLCKACSADPKVNSDARCAIDWKLPSTKHSGDFAAVMEESLFRKNCSKRENSNGERGLKIGDLNDKLDELVEAKGDGKAKVFEWLIRQCSPSLMKWIILIVLKDLKIGMSEILFLREYHPDAEGLFNNTMDLHKVVTTLKDTHVRLLKHEIEPGQPVRPQLATAVQSPKDAFAKLKGRAYIVETKFDGERMQLHKIGGKVYYFSRSANEHGEQSGYRIFDDVINQLVKTDTCVLDGELVVWNRNKRRFEPFGGLKAAFSAASGTHAVDSQAADSPLEELDTKWASQQLKSPCPTDWEIVYVAFDVLHCGQQSTTDKPLRERYKILQDIVRNPTESLILNSSPITGSIVPLTPVHDFIDGARHCRVVTSEDDVQAAYDKVLQNQEEGLILKALDNPWKANDRSDSWLKLKPDYVHQSEIDAVIIGGHYGTGRRAGIIAEYLLALADGLSEHSHRSFVSFCRVGTGVSDDERDAISTHLKDNIMPANVKPPNSPSCYRITGSLRERPDVWVVDPQKSVVLEVAADVRLIVSSNFASRHSLRFPRVQRVRWDKSAADIQSQEELWGKLDGLAADKGRQPNISKRRQATKVRKSATTFRAAALGTLRPPELNVERISNVLKDAKIVVLSYGTGERGRDHISKLIAEMGGQLHMSVNPAVTHYLAEDPHNWQVRTHSKRHLDILTIEWLLEISRSKRLMTPRPRHYVFLSSETRKIDPQLVDSGDLLFEDLSASDMEALLSRHMMQDQRSSSVAALVDAVKQLMAKGCLPAMSFFRGCQVCIISIGNDKISREIRIAEAENARLMVQVCGGTVSTTVTKTTSTVLLLDGHDGMQCTVYTLLDTVLGCHGGRQGLVNLQRGLSTGRLRICSRKLIERKYAAALCSMSSPLAASRSLVSKADAELSDELHLPRACENGLIRNEEIMSASRILACHARSRAPICGQCLQFSIQDWPWYEHGVKPEHKAAERKATFGRKRSRYHVTAGATIPVESISHIRASQLGPSLGRAQEDDSMDRVKKKKKTPLYQ